MIVNLLPNGWECIYQQAHALLAARIGAHWHPDRRPVPERWAETIAALTQHDDGQDSWTGANGLTPAGAPAPFKLVPFSLAQAQRVVAQGGQYQQSLPAGRSYHLLRLRLERESQLVPEISGHRLMVSVRFMRADAEGRMRPVTDDQAFELSLCA